MTGMTISRRGFLQGAGALIVTFGLPIKLRAQLATALGVPADQLTVKDGAVSVHGDASRSVSYGDLIGGRRFQRTIGTATPKRPADYTVVGTSTPRKEIPAKVTGVHAYVQNVRLPGMLHGRVVRPATIGAHVERVDDASLRSLPGVVQAVRMADFVGVVCEREEQAIHAAQALTVTWREAATLPEMSQLYRTLRGASTTDKTLTNVGDV